MSIRTKEERMFRPRCVSTWGVRCPLLCDVQSWHMFSGWDSTTVCHRFHAEVYFHVSIAAMQWRGLIQPARTSWFCVSLGSNYHGGNLRCKENINISIFQYWDVKFRRGPLTPTGNHEQLWLPGKFDSLSLFLPWLPHVFGATVGPLSSSLLHLSPTEPFGSSDWWRGLSSLTVDIYQEPLLGVKLARL